MRGMLMIWWIPTETNWHRCWQCQLGEGADSVLTVEDLCAGVVNKMKQTKTIKAK